MGYFLVQAKAFLDSDDAWNIPCRDFLERFYHNACDLYNRGGDARIMFTNIPSRLPELERRQIWAKLKEWSENLPSQEN